MVLTRMVLTFGQWHTLPACATCETSRRPPAGLKAERASFPEVSKALEKVALEKGLQLHGPWLNKCIQLYETYLVRHGIMLVGVEWRRPGIKEWRKGRLAG
jgi:hypothetical protein